MAFRGLRKFKPRMATGAGLVAVFAALAVLSGCVVVPAYGPGPAYYRGGGGYYAPGYDYRQNNYYRY